MIKTKSRDFLLMVCGLLLLFIALCTIIINLVVTVEKISTIEHKRRILENVKVTAVDMKIVGKGNFFKKGPQYSDLVISDFNVKFVNKEDVVRYQLTLCNENDEDVLIQEISMGNMICSENDGNEVSCSEINIKKDFYVDNQKIEENTYLKSRTCAKAVINITYGGENLEEEIFAHIDQFILNIKPVKK